MALDRRQRRTHALAWAVVATVSLSVGLVVLVAFALPIRAADPIGALVQGLLALLAFIGAGVGVTIAALVLAGARTDDPWMPRAPRTRSRPSSGP
jgi:hypothetical protein